MLKILTWLLPILTAIPSLIQAVEGLWSNVPKSGAQKWISVETALSQSIQTVGQEIVKAVPNAQVDAAAAKVDLWAKAVNDATVALFNDVGLLPHAGQPAQVTP